MFADLGRIYDRTVTIVNRLDAKDAGLKADEYRATALEGCMWASKATRSVQSDGTVVIGTVHTVQVPESAAYVPYREWAGLEAREGTFTVREGDYVLLGTVEGEVTASNVKKVAAAHEPDAFQVQHFRDLTKGGGFSHSTAGALRFAECYYIEG